MIIRGTMRLKSPQPLDDPVIIHNTKRLPKKKPQPPKDPKKEGEHENRP